MTNQPQALERQEVDGVTDFLERDQPAGRQHLYTFSNGYQASVVSGPYTYGVEMGILKDGKLDYTTPLTDDVIPYIQDMAELKSLLEQVAKLKKGVRP